jgi:putative addiction module component (TIGR02574 family)
MGFSMSKKVSISDVLELTPDERIRLVEEIWDSIAGVPEAVELTPTQRDELDVRLAEYRANPKAGDPWSVVKARILKGR